MLNEPKRIGCRSCGTLEWRALLHDGKCPVCWAKDARGELENRPVDQRRLDELERALKVLVLTPLIRWTVRALDPMALRQADAAVNDPVSIAEVSTRDPKDPRVTLLLTAQELVGTVLASLDRSEANCPHCGLTTRTNWTEHQTGLELEAIMRKLAKLARALGDEEGSKKESKKESEE